MLKKRMDYTKNKISVIVPVFNGSEYIAETIKSVTDQTYDRWELILIDDGSTDNSIEIIKHYVDEEKIFLLTHSENANKGVSKSRALGVDFSTGEYIAFLDADDLFYPNKLKEQISLFDKFDDIVLTHSKVDILNETDISFGNDFAYSNEDKVYRFNDQNQFLKSNFICNSTVVVKSNVLKKINFGTSQLFQYEDWLLWSLLAREGLFYYQNLSLLKYRIHTQSATSALIKNELIPVYSKIEYLLSFYKLQKDAAHSLNIINELNNTVIELFKVYADRKEGLTKSFSSDFLNPRKNDNYYENKYNDLLGKYMDLENKMKSRSLLKKVFKRITRL